MSLYSFTRLNELSGSYINTRTLNSCHQSNIHTVYDLWQRRYSLHVPSVGKKGKLFLQRIIRKAEGVMDVMPLTTGATAPAQKPGFTLPSFYQSLDDIGKQVAENIYRRFVMHIRASGRQKLHDACGSLTLAALVKSMLENEKEFDSHIYPHRYRYSEAGYMLYALKTFFQGSVWEGYAANLPLTLLRHQVHTLAGSLSFRMDSFLTASWNRIGSPQFPLAQFITTFIDAADSLPRGEAGKMERACKACRHADATAGKLLAEARETYGPSMLKSAISILLQHGFRLPQHYHLANKPYHTGDVNGTVLSRGFQDVFLTLLCNPAYGVVRYRTGSGMALLLVKTELIASLNFAELLREVYNLKNECIREAYPIDLFSLVCSFYEEDGTADEDELVQVTAAIINDVYDLQTDAEGQLELKRTSQKQTWEHIHDVLTEKGQPCTVSGIEAELDKRKVVVTRETVRHHLNDKDDFKPMGHDGYERLYGLSAWKEAYKLAPPPQPASVIMMIAER